MLPRYQKSIALFLSFVIALQSISCIWEPYMGYDMLFDKDIIFHNSKKNISYNAWYYNEELYSSENLNFQNADSWVAFLEAAYRREDLISFIYRSEINYGSREKELLKLRKNRRKVIKAPLKEIQFVDCIIFALKVEKLMIKNTPNPWEDTPVKINLVDFSPLINQANIQINASLDPFIKERYAFQLIKLYRYSKQYNAFVANYKKYFENKQSMISAWAMEHYAGVLSETKKRAEANYYFAKVYMNCPSKRSSSYLSMKLSSTTDFERTLSLCSNDEEKMALYYIHAMQTKSLAMAALKKITQNIGNHEYARIVMSHEINKLEKILLIKEEKEEDFEYQSEQTKELRLLKGQVPAYLKELIQMNQNMLVKDDANSFWHLSLAYLYYLDNQYDACTAALKDILPSSPEIQKQHDIIFIINYLDAHNSLTEEDENILGEKLFSINEHNPNYNFFSDKLYTNESFLGDEYNTINELFFRKIAERYQASNSFVATIFSGKYFTNDLCIKSAVLKDNEQDDLEFQVNDSDIDLILSDLKRTPESKLSLFAASYYFQTVDYLYSKDTPKLPTLPFRICEQKLLELKATILLRNPALIDQALEIYTTLPSKLTNEKFVYGSPFTYSSKSPNFSLHDQMQDRFPKITRLEFAQNVKRLSTQPLTAENAFELGVAYYNCSYYGLQWKLLAYYRQYSSPDGNVDMSVAENYLNTALSLGGLTQERQAQAYFMLARCEQNRYPLNYDYGEGGFTDNFDKMKSSGRMRNLQKLASNYYGTATFQEIIRQCKYFEYYIN